MFGLWKRVKELEQTICIHGEYDIISVKYGIYKMRCSKCGKLMVNRLGTYYFNKRRVAEFLLGGSSYSLLAFAKEVMIENGYEIEG